MNKKADVWVSAVIYVGLAITIITIVLAAGMPVINRLRDKNTEIQTKDIMQELDTTIKDVVREGPGSRRTPIIKISKGEFNILEENGKSKIRWTLPNSRFMLSEPGAKIREGNIVVTTTASQVNDEYKVVMELVYDNVNLVSNIKTFSGQYNLVITNEGVDVNDNTKIKVSINELSV